MVGEFFERVIDCGYVLLLAAVYTLETDTGLIRD